MTAFDFFFFAVSPDHCVKALSDILENNELNVAAAAGGGGIGADDDDQTTTESNDSASDDGWLWLP